MRTSIILDDELGQRLRDAAAERGQSLSAFLAEAGRAKLGTPPVEKRPFELIVTGKSGVHTGVDLNHTTELLVAEDQSNYGP